MAEAPDPLPAHADADPAALAFEALREEVALVRRAVARLAAERAAIELPDYSETLGHIMRASAATAQNLKALAEMPALRRSAKDWGRDIAFAAEDARRSDQQAFADAQRELGQMVHEMAAYLRAARLAEDQRLLLIWAAAGGVAAGMLLMAIVIGLIARITS
jgi:uncharacterized protein DUF6118